MPTMAMFQPEIATTCVRPAVAKAALTSGAMLLRTPRRMPAPRDASGSGTMVFRPPTRTPRRCAAPAARPSA